MSLLHVTLLWHPLLARCVSFPAALTVTWWLNRRWVFAPSPSAAVTAEYARYAAVQVAGAIVNLVIFAVLIYSSDRLMRAPWLALSVGAACSLVLNYLLLTNWVYAPRKVVSAQLQCGAPAGYSGITNLEIMSEAARYNGFLQRRVMTAAPDNPQSVIDFGAGTGTFTWPLSNSGLPVIAVEPDAELRRRLVDRGLEALESLEDISDASVDYLYTLNVLEHVPDDKAVLAQFSRVVRAGGKVLIYVPAFMLLFGAMDRRVGHLRRYRMARLRELVTNAGLEVDSLEYVDSLGFLASLLMRFAGSPSGVLDPAAVRFYDRWCFPASRLLDRVVRRWFGKNLLIVAHRPRHTAG